MIGCCRACLMFVFLNFNKFFLQQTKEVNKVAHHFVKVESRYPKDY